MKKFLLVFAIFLLIQGCATQTPMKTYEQRVSTLNIYENNIIVFEEKFEEKLRTPDKFGWAGSDRSIFAVKIHGQYYNTKDLLSVRVKKGDRSEPDRVVFTFKDGREIMTTYKANPKWVQCDISKKCTTVEQSVVSADYRIGGLGVQSIYDRDFFNPRSINAGLETGFEETIRNDYGALPQARLGAEITFYNDAQIADFFDTMRKNEAVWKDKRQAYLKSEAAAEARGIAEVKRREIETIELRKNIRIGSRTNCGIVFDIREREIAGIQTQIGQQYIAINELHGPSSACKFHNGKYVGR